MHGMMKIFSNFKDFYNEINGATLTGAIDVIVVEQPDGSYNCSPFHVRFGKLGVLRSREKVVDIEINGEPQDIHMKLGESGEAFFVEELEEDEDPDIPEHLATSPLPIELEKMFKSGRRRSFDLEEKLVQPVNEVSDYSKRRYTGDTSNKARERDFIKRHIGLGNLESEEAKLFPLTVEKKEKSEETIFKMDALDGPEEAKKEVVESKSSKKKKKKMRKKNAPRKSSSINQIAPEVVEKISDSATDRSSLDSTTSEPELQKLEEPKPDMKKIDTDFHFFSDTELTSTAVDSRTGSPVHVETVLSDSEFEVKSRKEEEKEGAKSWEWGGFPNVSQAASPTSEMPSKEEQKSMMSSIFSFMKQKHGANTMQGGMYLDDIAGIDPEVAEIYFSKTKGKDADNDCESGNGPSLTQSPNSAEGCKSIDSDYEDHQHKLMQFSQDTGLSLCGWDPPPSKARFLEHVIEFSDLCNNPALFENPNLVVRIADKYYTWKVAAPIFTSVLVYGRPLLPSSVDHLCNLHMPRPVAQDKESPKQQETRSYWWSWRRSRNSRETTPALETSTETKTEAKEVTVTATNTETTTLTETKATNPEPSSLPEESNLSNSPPSPTSSDKYKKTLRLSSKQIASLNLRDGPNSVEFSVTTAYQGTTRCQCHLYKWKWDDKIVISDIDGTITKSDVLGHILPIVGKDWAQTGVAQLFNKIKDNGYKLLYLSARAIGQARITREYLKSIRQGDLTMPDGPILLNPTSLITAFHREVIEKKPEQFKIQCMSDIKALFPAEPNPFYAGYGNRINDVWAYRAVGIPIVRIFTINSKGELKHELTQTFQSSYSNMSCFVDQMFPPLIEAANDYSQFTYWRDPISVIEEIPELE